RPARRAAVAVGALDVRVAAAEDGERGERPEAALRGDGALPPRWDRTRDRAVERAARLIEPLPPYRNTHRRRAPVHKPAGSLEATSPLLDPLAHASRDPAPRAF